MNRYPPSLLRGPVDLVALRSAPEAPQNHPALSQPAPGSSPVVLSREQFDALTHAPNRTMPMQTRPFAVTTTPALILDNQPTRGYLFVQNQDAASNIVVGFGQAPSVSGTVANGLIIPPNLGYYEPLAVPTDELWIMSTAGTVAGFVLFSV